MRLLQERTGDEEEQHMGRAVPSLAIVLRQSMVRATVFINSLLLSRQDRAVISP